MQLNINTHKVAFTAGIITVIMIGFYTFSEEDSQVVIAPSQPVEQPQSIAKDPFKQFLDKQQQGTSLQPSQALPSQTIQIGDITTAKTVPVGTDPFKAFLEAQPKAKPEEAAISPFTGSK